LFRREKKCLGGKKTLQNTISKTFLKIGDKKEILLEGKRPKQT
jgi:hypothetical protein